jgi:hypothetical protein
MSLGAANSTKKHQVKLVECLVLEATARSSADLIDIQPNTAALFSQA